MDEICNLFVSEIRLKSTAAFHPDFCPWEIKRKDQEKDKNIHLFPETANWQFVLPGAQISAIDKTLRFASSSRVNNASSSQED